LLARPATPNPPQFCRSGVGIVVALGGGQENAQMKTISLGLLFVAIMSSAVPAAAQDKLTVWWVKGFYKAEDDALFAVIKKFEEKSGIKVELSQYPINDMIAKTVAALDSGSPPDVAYADPFDFQVTGKWAAEGKLEDLSSILAPMKDRFLRTPSRPRTS
jgi:ABC-type glycerol-3-phosphate transport system substrate-binding protein